MIERLKEITELKLNQGEVGLPVYQGTASKNPVQIC
jgi:hypothetical protein